MSTYQERINRYLERHPGATIAEARGHGKTPEHPGAQRGQERYAEYHERREAAESHVNALKQDAYGNLPNFNQEGSEFATSKMSISELQVSAPYDSIDEMYDALDEDEIPDGYGHYH
jgi:hypothetical protein